MSEHSPEILALAERKGLDDPLDLPIPMVLLCPSCGTQHVDAPEPERGWDNPPHRSHLCHGCGCVWRPADVPTVGVETVTTKGSADTWSPDDGRNLRQERDAALGALRDVGAALDEAGVPEGWPVRPLVARLQRLAATCASAQTLVADVEAALAGCGVPGDHAAQPLGARVRAVVAERDDWRSTVSRIRDVFDHHPDEWVDIVGDVRKLRATNEDQARKWFAAGQAAADDGVEICPYAKGTPAEWWWSAGFVTMPGCVGAAGVKVDPAVTPDDDEPNVRPGEWAGRALAAEEALDAVMGVFGSQTTKGLLEHAQELRAAIKQSGESNLFRPGIVVRELAKERDRFRQAVVTLQTERDSARRALLVTEEARSALRGDLDRMTEECTRYRCANVDLIATEEAIRTALGAAPDADLVVEVTRLRADADQWQAERAAVDDALGLPLPISSADRVREIAHQRAVAWTWHRLTMEARRVLGVEPDADLVEAVRAAVTGHQERTAECVELRHASTALDTLRTALRRALPEAGPTDEALVEAVKHLTHGDGALEAESNALATSNPPPGWEWTGTAWRQVGAASTVEAIAEQCGLERRLVDGWAVPGAQYRVVWQSSATEWQWTTNYLEPGPRGVEPSEEAALRAYAAAKGINLGTPAEPPKVPKRYLPWENAGGPNECAHGYAQGIPCQRCDAARAADGRKDDGDKARWDLLPLAATSAVVDVLTYGARKYAPENWRKVPDGRDRYFAAALRHLVAWRRGETTDAESGHPHLAHAACCVLFLLETP